MEHLLASPTLAGALEWVEQEKHNLTRTEKGAVAFKSTLKATLDFFGQGASLRTALAPRGWGWGNRANRVDMEAVANQAQDLFFAAYKEDRLTALKIWAFIGDIRGGQGERTIRRAIIRWLAQNDSDVLIHNLPHLPIYFRWDDLWIATEGTQVEEVVWEFVNHQFQKDLRDLDLGNAVTLLGKWLPSENTSSAATRTRARKFIRYTGLTPREYRKALVVLRRRIGVVEQVMSANEWEKIAFDNVPSNASFIYRKAFAKHEPARYARFLEKVEAGDAVIHSATLYPYEIVQKYWQSGYRRSNDIDKTLEAQWKALPNFLGEDKGNSLVICDVSGSMWAGSPSPLHIALSLTIYTAERNKGHFKDKFLTFSNDSQLLTLKGDSLLSRINNLSSAPWGGITNLMAAFDRILETAIRYKVEPEHMPDTLFIISDMQFDTCVVSMPLGGSLRTTARSRGLSGTALGAIRDKYAEAGYRTPNIVFWNVRATNNVPVRYNDDGVALVSGFHPSTFAQLLGKIETPLHTMFKTVYQERYEPISLP